MNSLAERIKCLRQSRGQTLRGLAREVGVAPSFMLDIEADRRLPSADVLIRIAEALAVPASELQEVDPRLPVTERVAFRLALAADHYELERHLASLDDPALERLQRGADDLRDAALHELSRRHL